MKNSALVFITRNSKIALITGASSGIGEAFAISFAGLGYSLIITGRRKDRLTRLSQHLQARFGVTVEIFVADLSEDQNAMKLKSIIPNIRDY